MPELPDITAYITALEARILAQPLERVRLASVFLLRTVDPPLSAVEGAPSTPSAASASASHSVCRNCDLWLVLHL
jgi:formamidopyrimidine-DNA glycosylase